VRKRIWFNFYWNLEEIQISKKRFVSLVHLALVLAELALSIQSRGETPRQLARIVDKDDIINIIETMRPSFLLSYQSNPLAFSRTSIRADYNRASCFILSFFLRQLINIFFLMQALMSQHLLVFLPSQYTLRYQLMLFQMMVEPGIDSASYWMKSFQAITTLI